MKKANLNRLLLISMLFLATTASGQTITTFAGTGVAGYSGDGGAPTAAQLNSPSFISFGGIGLFSSLYIADANNNRQRRIKMGGIIMTIAGDGVAGFAGDGGNATAAQLNLPGGMAADKNNNVYFADLYNHRVRKVSNLGIITTIAGTGVIGFYGDGGPATNAQFNLPYCVALDTLGNIYVADQSNHRIRKIDTNGIISTYAGIGTSGFSGDGGPASAAEISYPNVIRMDTLGQLFITDNGHQRIRKINSSGIINTIAGNGTIGFSGDGGPATDAQLNYPGGIEMDSYGNVYIGDAFNDRVRMVDVVTGNISTIAGTGVTGYSGDGGPATAAQLNKPSGIAVDNHNNIYINDWHNNVIRKINAIHPTTSTKIIENEKPDINIYPCPSNGEIKLAWINFATGNAKISIADILGRVVYQDDINITTQNGETKLNLLNLNKGLYWITVLKNGLSYRKNIILDN